MCYLKYFYYIWLLYSFYSIPNRTPSPLKILSPSDKPTIVFIILIFKTRSLIGQQIHKKMLYVEVKIIFKKRVAE